MGRSEFIFRVKLLTCLLCAGGYAQETPLEPNAFAKEIARMGQAGQLDGMARLITDPAGVSQGGQGQGTAKINTNGTVRFYLYNNPRRPFERQELQTGDTDSLNQSLFNASNPIKMLLHPWLGIPVIPPLLFPYSAKNSYLLRHPSKYNVIIMDYTGTTGYPIYPLAATVGWRQAVDQGTEFLGWLSNETAVDMGQTHIIGLSLGAHIGAGIAERYKNNTGAPIARVTELDPAAPLFYPRIPGITPAHSMGPNDASYVDVGHTNAMIPGLGVMNNLGQADYYLNGGRTQPACQALSAVEATGIPGAGFALTTICSHLIAGEYYSFSILRDRTRPGCACTSQVFYYANPLCCSARVIFGKNNQPGNNGTFYMRFDPVSA